MKKIVLVLIGISCLLVCKSKTEKNSAAPVAKVSNFKIKKGEIKRIQHHIVAYSGKLDPVMMNDLWGDRP